MDIIIKNTSGVPIYQQLYDQISAQIITGALPADTCLPSIRSLAAELRVSVITVKRAWEELERDGYIYTMAGKGCFVAPVKNNDLERLRDTQALERLQAEVSYCRSLGLSDERIIELVRKCCEGK